MLQSLQHLHGPSLDSVHYVHISLALMSPEMDMLLQMCPHQCPVEGKDHSPQPGGSTFPSAAQDTISVLCCKGTLLAHVRLGVHQDTLDLFCKAAFQRVGCLPCCMEVGLFTQDSTSNYFFSFSFPCLAKSDFSSKTFSKLSRHLQHQSWEQRRENSANMPQTSCFPNQA